MGWKGGRKGGLLNEVSLILPLGGEFAHRRVADHDVDRLLEAPENGVLHVRHTVLLAQRFDERLRLPIRERRQVGPHVVLHLVIEPAVQEVVQIAARREVGARDDGAQVEGGRARRAVLLEAVQVGARVVGDDDEEGVRVGEQLGEDERHERVEVRVAAEEQPGDGRQEHEAYREEGAEHPREEDGAPEEHVGALAVEREQSPRPVEPARGDGLPRVLGVRVRRESGLLSLAAQLMEREHLESVRSVVDPLPRHHEEGDAHVLEEQTALILAY
mmetsp:Transcript_42918/g.100596  ORF Transcript_42918/g.100596 Transcript_42918/m.100596 type:complete len:273 (+) Transcript_42918:338-1156(+)